MTKPILLSGASGFLGSRVVTDLFARELGERIHLLMRSQPGPDSLLGLRFRDKGFDIKLLEGRIHFADFQNVPQLEATFAKLKEMSSDWVVIHLAAIINPRGDFAAQEKVNIEGTRRILNWANKNASHFIFSSSVVAFGATPSKKLRSEEDYSSYHPFNRLDSYSRSKRQAHDEIIRDAKVATSIFCPGIIHGAYEHKKSSRSHLKAILEGRVRWVPGGIGSFVALDTVSEHIVKAAAEPPSQSGVRVRLLNDVCIKYVEYFQLYRECAEKEKIEIHSLPTSLVYALMLPLALLKLLGFHAAMLAKITQALMNYNFKTERSLDEGRAILKAAILQSMKAKGA